MTGAIVAEWARLLLGSLAQCGVKDVVVSPGSRSTPFAWAAAHTPGLTCHSLYDERSAAFFALGMARVTAEPALLLCTSGSAAANYFPAIVEASLAHVPLLVMTADRPLELQDAGAPQTIDQVKLYGDFARSFFDLGVPDPAPASLAALRRVAVQAALATRSPVPGPVHLNARARKPLEPGPPETDHERAVAAEVERLLARGVTRTFGELSAPDPRGIAALAERLSRAERGVIVCGPLPFGSRAHAASIVALARKLRMPLYPEATSQLRFGSVVDPSLFVDGFDWLMRAPHRETTPDLVLRFGGTPVSAGIEQLLGAHGPTDLCVVTEHGYPDPTSSASLVVRGAVETIARGLVEALAEHTPRPAQVAFTETLKRANDIAWQQVETCFLPKSFDLFSELHAVLQGVRALPRGGLLAVGNSLPVREVDGFVRSAEREIGVVCQRGANGIDGVLSGAAGAAFAAKKPALLLIGDVSFAHDLSGLVAARRVETPFVVVVLDNDGGRIFDQLPVGHLPAYESAEIGDLWRTPPRVAFEHVARGFGVPYQAPATAEDLDRALGEGLERPGPSIVHVRASPRGTKDATLGVWHLVIVRLNDEFAKSETG